MIPLISSGFTDKLCKATDVYQRIHTTLMARVGGTGGEREGGKDRGKPRWEGKRERELQRWGGRRGKTNERRRTEREKREGGVRWWQ